MTDRIASKNELPSSHSEHDRLEPANLCPVDLRLFEHRLMDMDGREHIGIGADRNDALADAWAARREHELSTTGEQQ